MWLWNIVVCASLSAAVNIEGQFTFPDAPRLPESDNATFTDLNWSPPLLDKRQSTCYSPNRWCSNTGQCCGPNTNRCCQSGVCGQSTGGDCCGVSQCNADKPKCCSDKGCIGASDACCGTEGYCPSPFRCYEWYRNYVYQGLTCCTDSSCDVYWSNGATATRTTTVAQTIGLPTPRTSAPQLPATPTTRVGTGGGTFYSSTVYWIFDRNNITSAYIGIINDHTHMYRNGQSRRSGNIPLPEPRPANANRSPSHSSSDANSRSSHPRFLQPGRNNNCLQDADRRCVDFIGHLWWRFR
ncbi:hypothetical protein FB567DRAFT_550787 [Paraphoma chrysanthemicola]|uniref:Uncharacterized protein n=1 Tax=Paraphoma chrysanthemicola TaxID=798071 RepID=A0A8K0R0W8_9PLEO|nr:hypothetical protein FB567DRAFT_550787 [Paraphoma chrysanthemicola]